MSLQRTRPATAVYSHAKVTLDRPVQPGEAVQTMAGEHGVDRGGGHVQQRRGSR